MRREDWQWCNRLDAAEWVITAPASWRVMNGVNVAVTAYTMIEFQMTLRYPNLFTMGEYTNACDRRGSDPSACRRKVTRGA